MVADVSTEITDCPVKSKEGFIWGETRKIRTGEMGKLFVMECMMEERRPRFVDSVLGSAEIDLGAMMD